jgi:hypothetical protein
MCFKWAYLFSYIVCKCVRLTTTLNATDSVPMFFRLRTDLLSVSTYSTDVKVNIHIPEVQTCKSV